MGGPAALLGWRSLGPGRSGVRVDRVAGSNVLLLGPGIRQADPTIPGAVGFRRPQPHA
jgi:hypothetical protein